MKKSRYSESQIVAALARNEHGEKVKDICRDLGVSDATFYNWKAKYGGMSVSELKRIKELETENARLSNFPWLKVGTGGRQPSQDVRTRTV